MLMALDQLTKKGPMSSHLRFVFLLQHLPGVPQHSQGIEHGPTQQIQSVHFVASCNGWESSKARTRCRNWGAVMVQWTKNKVVDNSVHDPQLRPF